MEISMLYRKRYIPAECILLKDDVIVRQDENTLVTRWKTLAPKVECSHGCSCYFFKEGLKLSKMYRPDGSLLRWYCDIVDFSYEASTRSLTVTDLLADVIVSPDGQMRVVDLDELADACEQGFITKEQTISCLRSLDYLLSLIYCNNFGKLQAHLSDL